jgi:hypothetical protein
MLALPEGLGGWAGLTALALGATLGGAFALFVFARAAAALRPAPAARPIAAALAVSAAAAVGGAPFTAWRIGHDIEYNAGLSRQVAERIGAYENYLDATIFDELDARLPADATFYVAVSASVPEPRGSASFGPWAMTWLLPRRAVDDPSEADWILTWGVEPRSLGIRSGAVETLRPAKYGFPAVYLAPQA